MKATQQVTKYLTVAETQELLGVGRTTLYRLLDSGELVSVKIGKARRIPIDQLARYQASLLKQTAMEAVSA